MTKDSKNVLIVLLVAVIVGMGIVAYQKDNSKTPLRQSVEKIGESIEDAGDEIEDKTDDLAD